MLDSRGLSLSFPLFYILSLGIINFLVGMIIIMYPCSYALWKKNNEAIIIEYHELVNTSARENSLGYGIHISGPSSQVMTYSM